MLDLFQGTERRQENNYPKFYRQFKQYNNENMNSLGTSRISYRDERKLKIIILTQNIVLGPASLWMWVEA